MSCSASRRSASGSRSRKRTFAALTRTPSFTPMRANGCRRARWTILCRSFTGTAKNGQSYPLLDVGLAEYAKVPWMPGLATTNRLKQTYTGAIVDEIKARGPRTSAGAVHCASMAVQRSRGAGCPRKTSTKGCGFVSHIYAENGGAKGDDRGGGNFNSWMESGERKAFWFVVYAKDKDGWTWSVLPAAEKSISLTADRKIEKIVVTSVDRLGNESNL